MEIIVKNQLLEDLGTVRLNTLIGPYFLDIGPQSTGDLNVPTQVLSVDIFGQTVVSPDPGPINLPDGSNARLTWKGDQEIEIINISNWGS